MYNHAVVIPSIKISIESELFSEPTLYRSTSLSQSPSPDLLSIGAERY